MTTALDTPPATDRRSALRRNAVFYLFRRAGLGPPPALMWSFITDDDVGRGLDAFLHLTGSDAEPARLDDLLRAEPGLRRASATDRSAWLAGLLSRDPVRISAAARAARRLTAPLLEEHWPADLIPEPQPEHADAGHDIAASLSDHRDHRATLLAQWPEAWTDGSEGADVCAAIAAFEAAEVAALASLTDGADLRHSLRAMRTANADLEHLAARAGAGGIQTAPAADTSLLDIATDWPEAMAQWRALRWQHHPDRPELDAAARAACLRQCAAIDRALDRRERLLRAGPP